MLKILVNLIIIGIGAKWSGKVVEFIKLPALIGMMFFGMLIGPFMLNLIPNETLAIAPAVKSLALIIILFMGGLGISLEQIKQIGRPAILLSIIPAVLEGFTIAFVSTKLLGFSFIQGAILGFIIAAVSPAVLVPSMISLIKRKVGQDKAIPQMLLVGASADDTIAITLFTTFLTLYLQQQNGEVGSIWINISFIPLTIALSLSVAYLVFKLTKPLINLTKHAWLRTGIAFGVCIVMRLIENAIPYDIFNSLLAIMVFGFLIYNYLTESAEIIMILMDKAWMIGRLYLFTFVGMAINPTLVGNFLVIGITLLVISLTVRSFGVLLSLIGTNLTWKERLFCIIAYLPKATVQSAKASIPLQMGVEGGVIMEAIAILSVLVTAPIGAIGIKLTSDRLLSLDEVDETTEIVS